MGEVLGKEQLYYPSESKKDNDFIGFSFGGIHSSTLGIVRVSDGSRFNESLLPAMQDKTVSIPGGDGTYYFGSYYTQRQFSVSIGFDSLTDENVRKLKQWLGDKKIKDLIFDEAPYKVYRAKVTGSTTFKHICFLENGQRIYKGEGSIQFTCYEPFAKIPDGRAAKTKEFYTLDKYPTRDEWIATSGILTASEMESIDRFDDTNVAKLYNPGDLECDFVLTMFFEGENTTTIPARTLSIDGDVTQSLKIGEIIKKGNDAGVKVDSKSNLIFGIDDKERMTGTTYNEYIEGGHFFKIPICKMEDKRAFYASNYSFATRLEYRWLYF